jgi:hypothetical protein
MNKYKTKQERREQIARKLKSKKKSGATLAGQIKHTQVVKKYAGSVKRFKI